MSVPVALVFAAGGVSFLSPCIVPMISVYLILITGMTLEELKAAPGLWARRSILLNTLLFVLGFPLVFTAAGGAAGAVGSPLRPGGATHGDRRWSARCRSGSGFSWLAAS